MSTSKTHVTRIGTVLVPVSDQDRALCFCTETLGLETRIDGVFGEGERWIEVAPPAAGSTIALVDSQATEVGFATDSCGRCARGASGSWRRRRGAAPRRGRAGHVRVPGSGRQPLPSGRARLTARGQAAAVGRGGLPVTRSGHRTVAAHAASRSASSRGQLRAT
jgi:hypothetical protein